MKRSRMPRSSKPLRRRSSLKAVTPPQRKTPLRSRPSHRARPDEPLATWCTARLAGFCTGRATDRHHILPRSAGGTDDATNTTDVCNPCHIAGIHDRPAWAYSVGLLKRRAA